MQIRPSPTGAIAPDASVQTRARDRAQVAGCRRDGTSHVGPDARGFGDPSIAGNFDGAIESVEPAGITHGRGVAAAPHGLDDAQGACLGAANAVAGGGQQAVDGVCVAGIDDAQHG